MTVRATDSVGRVLVVSHDEALLARMSAALETLGRSVLTTTDPIEGLRLLRTKDVELIIAELRMTPIAGVALLSCAYAARPDVRRVIMAAPEDVPATAMIDTVGLMALAIEPFSGDDAATAPVVQGLLRRRATTVRRPVPVPQEHAYA